MAQMPIEVIEIGDLTDFDVNRVLALANSLQREFAFSTLDGLEAQFLKNYVYQKMRTAEFLDSMEEFRRRAVGFHPYLIAFVDSYLIGDDYANIFGTDRPKKGLAVFTTCGVPDTIIPRDRMLSYFMYYLAKPTLCFLAPDKKDHDDTKACVFDRKVNKPDIVQSMRARALCDACRRELLTKVDPVSPSQLTAIDRLFTASGDLYEGKRQPLPRAFIGSSKEGLAVARELQKRLAGELITVIWDQDDVFSLGNVNLESLEEAVLGYDYGIFVFTPDDRLESRGQVREVARDNVLFELGLFMGKLTRRRAFVVQANGVSMPSDLSGFVSARYDPRKADLSEALESAVNDIRSALGRERSARA
jgi:hypothetical protein